VSTRAPFHPDPAQRIARAWLTSTSSGVIELGADWTREGLPPLAPGDDAFEFATLMRADPALYAEEAAYYVNGDNEVCFMLDPAEHTWVDFATMPVYVAGTFNGWEAAVGQAAWRLAPEELNGRPWLVLRVKAAEMWKHPAPRFKFVTGDHRWLDLPRDATNVAKDETGHYNRALWSERTGRNLFTFTTAQPLRLSQAYAVTLRRDGTAGPKTRLRLGKFFHEMRSDAGLGALTRRDETIFRLFAPRAKYVKVFVCEQLDAQDTAPGYDLDPGEDGVWEARLDRNLHGWYYWYSVGGPHDVFGHFHPNQRVLDPYAKAAVSREGPGIVLDAAWIGEGDRSFRTPAWQDLVIAEAHVRDLVAKAPGALTAEERRGFSGLAKWLERPDCYLKKLGVNCLELQPVQEHDNKSPEDYQWGYMPANWFAPASAYALEPAHASQVGEMQELVQACHRQGLAVILDVVYNHAGEPAHPLYIDKLYYFELEDDGALSNWSGCGNDLRCRAAMVKRLIIDSLTHWIEAYGVDGFRFDLAELIGVDVLREIEAALKKVKPDVILIAEPWSFRGHIAAALRPTGYASWNDGYRDFVRGYVHARGTPERLEYFLKGSPWHFAYWPAQTVNYTESHDDRCWLDAITENAGHNGDRPTLGDVRRTHLMAALLFASVGIPMLAAGQDFLRSKQGVNNTYLRGDLNALDYRRLARFSGTHAYFADWIAFRRSAAGRLLRQWSRPAEGFFKRFSWPEQPALALLYNADGSQGRQRLLFAVNPHVDDATVPLGEWAGLKWRLIADHERFYLNGRGAPPWPVEEELFIPALGCALWAAEV